MLKAHKEGALIIFDVDGRRCTYNLATHDTIGFSGRSVKSLNSQLAAYTLDDVIEAFDNEHYRRFLKFISNYGAHSGSLLRNPATVFSRIAEYARFEQYYAAGIYKFDHNIPWKLSEIPKPVLKFGRDGGAITTALCQQFKANPDASNTALTYEGNLSMQQKADILEYGSHRSNGVFLNLVENNGYNATHLIRYLDRVITYEALNVYSAMQNLNDYVRMMSVISPKYDKYPRNLLTTHQIAIRNHARLREQFDEQAFEKARKPELECMIGPYAFIYPKCVQEIKDEAVQQNNCVASYIKSVIDGRCDIMFMRDKLLPQKSLVTLEVRDRCRIVQAYQHYNTPCTQGQLDAIRKWEERQMSREEKSA